MQLDGTYARLVRIQTQVARNKQFEAALNGMVTNDVLEDEPSATPEGEATDEVPRWLVPDTATLHGGPHQTLELTLPDGSVCRGVFAVRCFPATRPEEFISLRMCERDGQERELGMLRQLSDWSPESQSLIRAALSRRYLFRQIDAIDDIKLEQGYLNFQVRTDQGPSQFTMRWTQAQTQDFGDRGKVLVDVEDNRFLIPDVNALPRRQCELFQRFVYW
jgi:hypothetical protein